eukprot:TRINITY_DN15790_c0_g1_i3.p2 TRINITY_DN15790_c0_g1~~TRINITY_DN15790_c0_g1_i3.p2  ORF type:complete len:103 (-),score=19.41 TRINITY_DN15790_c0_g1_i3:591-854(-)
MDTCPWRPVVFVLMVISFSCSFDLILLIFTVQMSLLCGQTTPKLPRSFFSLMILGSKPYYPEEVMVLVLPVVSSAKGPVNPSSSPSS